MTKFLVGLTLLSSLSALGAGLDSTIDDLKVTLNISETNNVQTSYRLVVPKQKAEAKYYGERLYSEALKASALPLEYQNCYKVSCQKLGL